MSSYLRQKTLKITNQIIRIYHFPFRTLIIVSRNFNSAKLACLGYYLLDQVINIPEIHRPIDHFNLIHFNLIFFLELCDQMIILK